MKTLKWLDENFEKYTTAILFMLFSGIMIVNVILRFGFKTSLPWASELVLTIFVWFVWLGISYGFKERAHISVNAILSKLSSKYQVYLYTFVNVCIIAFFVILVKSGFELLVHFSVQGKTSLLINYPMWIFYLSAPIGLGLSVVRIIQNIIFVIKEYKTESIGR